MPAKLFTSVRVGDLDLKHRVVLAPLTRLRAPEHVPDAKLVAEYYRQRAQRPGTLLITEATFIHKNAGGMNNVPGIWSEEQTKAWSEVFKAVHEAKSQVFVQLFALGRTANPKVAEAEGFKIVSASNIPDDTTENSPVPHALTQDEIKEYVQWYVQAAKNAIAAGADGVEIHAANGFLLSQFLTPSINDRTDKYGGSIENRSRIVLELLDAVADAIGPRKVAIRLSPWADYKGMRFDNSPIPQYSHLVDQIEVMKKNGKDLAYIHLIEPRINLADDRDNQDIPHHLNEFIGDIWTGPIIRSGNVNRNAVEFAEKHDDRTLIAIGRYFISNPDLVDKLEKGEELTKYDRSTFYTQDAKGYTDYPAGTVAA